MFSSGGASEGDTLLSPAGAHEPAFTVIAALVVGATTIGLMMMLVLR